jgi:phenylacetate-coenzyme A ligase PaaK-like adenylate-forming protein
MARLQNLLSHAYPKVPYHREKFQPANVRPDEITNIEDLRRMPSTP